MKLGWKVLIPAGLVWLLLVATMRSYINNTEDRRDIALWGGGVLVVICLVIAFWPAKEEAEPAAADAGAVPFDPFAGGYPVPPLPGQVPAGTLAQVPREVTGGRD
jgi:NADH-quinone oxidoreductase subunit H